ncbi:alpha/beta fold hydrolase [Flavobacterium sp. GCM10023249]|uniref:alpha/beta fold hydrolase n=1 Tax=unclassified Flavobacterium TaxID=196869 RepID=UPI0036100DDA
MEKTASTFFSTKGLFLFVLLISVAFPSFGQKMKPKESGFASTNGTKVYYEVYGEGQPLFLLHGAFYTIEMNWSELLPELAKTRKVIAIEFQGHGHTPYSDRKLEITTLAKDVEGVMDYLKIETADVAGFSIGGSIAYQFAIQSPKRLRKLIIISSTYKTEGWLPIVNNAFEGFKPEFFDNSPLKTAYDAIAPDKTKWRQFLEQMFVFAKEPFNCGDANIAKITAPVLLIAGDNDGLDKVELMKTYQLLGGGITADMQPMPKSQLAIVPAQGHLSVMMQTKTIINYIEDFLK